MLAPFAAQCIKPWRRASSMLSGPGSCEGLRTAAEAQIASAGALHASCSYVHLGDMNALLASAADASEAFIKRE